MRPDADALSSASRQRQIEVQRLLTRYMPEAMSDGIVKTAIVRNFPVSDHARQFLAGCTAEGRSMGFIVDTFITGGDNEFCRQLIEKISQADYDGLVLSHGGADFTAEALKPALEKGIKVVTFDALPCKNGNPAGGILDGVTSTSQDDITLARISVEALLNQHNRLKERQSPAEPLRVIRAWFGPGILPLDSRQTVYDGLIRAGTITEAAVIAPRDFAASREGIRDALTAILPRFPEGTVDAVWAPYDDFARGCMDALNTAGRRDIMLTSIDISDDDIKMMLDNSAVWIGTAAADPGLIGIVNMRILAAKLAGEFTPDTHIFNVRFVKTSELNRMVNMSNIAFTVSGWEGDAGLYDQYPWMTALKTAGGKQRDITHAENGIRQ